MHYFTIEQRETLQRQLEELAATLRAEIGEEVRAGLNAGPEAAALAPEVAELREVEAALVRLHEPEFGVCSDCAAAIPYARLYAQPAATRCLSCQTKAERP